MAIYCSFWISYVGNNSSRMLKHLPSFVTISKLRIMNSWANPSLSPGFVIRDITCEILSAETDIEYHQLTFAFLTIFCQLDQLKSFYNGKKVSKYFTALILCWQHVKQWRIKLLLSQKKSSTVGFCWSCSWS